jgi:hypothetical protein
MKKRITQGKKARSHMARKKAKPGRSAPSVAARLPVISSDQVHSARKASVRGILSRGEAVPLGMPLTRGVTHEVVGQERDGTAVLKRKRFSLR